MNVLQKRLQPAQEIIGQCIQFTQLRNFWPRPRYYEFVYPPYFKRYPPPPGTPAKVYPLEPAMEEKPYKLDRWTDWKMKKDYLRRQCVIKHGRERMMVDTIHRNSILPYELRDAAHREVQENFPRDSDKRRLVNRCAVTSRPRGCVPSWRVSRFIFRHLADYNQLAGVQRGIW